MSGAQTVAGVLWDIDGTLILTEDLHFRTILDFCASRGVVLTPADNAALLGKTMPEKWRHLRDAHRIPDTLDAFRYACLLTYRRGLPGCAHRPGPLSVLHAAHARGLAQGCVSNGDAQVVDANLEALGIGSMVRFALHCGDYGRGKPDPEPYALACERLGLDPGRCLAVEDSAVGVLAAARAGLTVVAWPDPVHGPLDADFSSADYVVGSLNDFPLHLLGLAITELEVRHENRSPESVQAL
ncbi:HAD family hydrolase [Desulfocurvus sp. DL9XJH121]